MTNQTLSFPNANATYDVRDDKLRIYFDSRLNKTEYQHVRNLVFLLAPKQGCFYAVWTPAREDFILSLCEEINDEDTSPLERAKQRSERFEEYSNERKAEAEAVSKTVDDLVHLVPFERIDNGMRRSISCWNMAEYWKDRAIAVTKHSEYKERSDVRYRRIKKIEAQQRKNKKYLDESELRLSKWREEPLTLEQALFLAGIDALYINLPLVGNISLWRALTDKKATVQEVQNAAIKYHKKNILFQQRWISHCEYRLVYEKTIYSLQEGSVDEKWQHIEIGGKIKIIGGSDWHNILRVNKRAGKIISVTADDPHFSKWVYTLEKIEDYQAASQ